MNCSFMCADAETFNKRGVVHAVSSCFAEVKKIKQKQILSYIRQKQTLYSGIRLWLKSPDTMPRRPACGVFQATRFDFNDVSAQNLAAIKQYFDANGFVLGKIYGLAKCKEYSLRLWNDVIQTYPRTNKPVLYDTTGHAIDTTNPGNMEAFWTAITSPLCAKHRRELHAALPPGVAFGRPISNESFQNDVLNECRENPNLYEVASTILEAIELFGNFDGTIYRAPDAGDDDFAHLDLNGPQDAAARRKEKRSIQGKLALTPGQKFQAVIASHTVAKHEEMLLKYGTPKKGKAKWPVRPDNDPMGFFDNVNDIWMEEGEIIFWSPYLVHAHFKRPVDACMGVGLFIGYRLAGSRPIWLKKTGETERAARRRMCKEGTAPKLHPSLDDAPYICNNFRTYPKLMKAEIAKRDPGDPTITTRVNGRGETVPHLENCARPGYVPFDHSPLGRKLMGIDRWDSDCSASGSESDGGAAASAPGAASGAWRPGRASGTGGSGAAQKAAAPAAGKRKAVASDSDSDDGTAAGAPRKPAAQAAPVQQAGWQCAVCTLINVAGALACAACDTLRRA